MTRPATLRLVVLLALALGAGCVARTPPTSVAPVVGPAVEPKEVAQVPHVRFTDVTEQAGIRFKHTNGSFGQKLLPETMGAGVAFLDYDRDGKQDILFVNSCYWPGHEDRSHPAPTHALYRNKGDGTFEDVTVAAGLAVTMYGMGVAVGDYDNDGWPDVFLAGVGGNRLLHNEKGRFADVTSGAGVGGPGGWPAGGRAFLDHKEPIPFSTSATFLDYDRDGRLDLFVCNYITWSPFIDLAQKFTLVGIGRAFGPPKAFEGDVCLLYRNKGDGGFEDVSAKAGVQVVEREGVGPGARQRKVGKSLGVVVCDPDEDGWPDVLVANDTVRNFFFHNVAGPDGGRAFEEIGIRSGVAYAEGTARGAMGIDVGEYRPGRVAVLIANFADEPNTFLRLDNKDKLYFSNTASAEGLEGPSRTPLKFGAFFFDYDLDGRLDLLTCNGHLEPDITKVQPSQHHAQPVQLFWNTGAERQRAYTPVTPEQAGSDLFKPLVGRGGAFADIDGDGDLDVVVTANGGAARLLRNDGGTKHRWIRFVLEGDGKRSNASAIGAKVTVKAGGRELRREVTGARGYLSQSELPLTFGLGTADKVDEVTIRWPGTDKDKVQVIKNPAVDQTHTIRQAE